MSELFKISGFNIYLQIIVTIISLTIHLYATRNKNRKETTLELSLIYTIGLAGWFSIVSGLMGHIIYADQVAESIGWPVNSGFQMELAFAAIGIGLIGFIGFWNKSFWLPFIIVKTIFMWGAGFTHIIHMIELNNYSPSNSGLVLYWDFILPIILIVLYVAYQKEKKKQSTT
ncbi:MAG: hypothetical protein JEZ00_04160 [Anaerolineaceae bacterium]|nr:hypothetical protein [Anaerolineaceae bacterium]